MGAQAGGVEGEVLGVGDEGAVAAFGDAEAVDGGAGLEGELLVEVRGLAVWGEGDFFGEFLDGFAWVLC